MEDVTFAGDTRKLSQLGRCDRVRTLRFRVLRCAYASPKPDSRRGRDCSRRRGLGSCLSRLPARPCPAAAATCRRAPGRRPSVRRSRTEQSGRDSACAIPQAAKRTSRGRRSPSRQNYGLAMGDACSCFKGLLGGLDLLRNRDRHSRVVGLLRQRTGDRNADYARLFHIHFPRRARSDVALRRFFPKGLGSAPSQARCSRSRRGRLRLDAGSNTD